MTNQTLGILNLAAAFIIAILSGLGVGSGGLLVAYFTVTGQAGADVRALNLFFFILSAGAASLFNIGARRLDRRLIFIMSAFGIIGCLIGTFAGKFISADGLRRIFGGLLLFSGVYALVPKRSKNKEIPSA